eukprot:1159851-Pelagomonas_calceolata.AAC.3
MDRAIPAALRSRMLEPGPNDWCMPFIKMMCTPAAPSCCSFSAEIRDVARAIKISSHSHHHCYW